MDWRDVAMIAGLVSGNGFLCGIFLRIGGLSAALEALKERVGSLEGRVFGGAD
jgi:hypothetical protein